MRQPGFSYRTHMARCLLGAAFLATTPLVVHSAEWPPSFNLSTLNGTTGFQAYGTALGDLAGKSVSSAGDVNGDGFSDLVIGAYAAPNKVGFGASFVVFGKADGFASEISLSTLDGSNGFRVNGVATNDFAGIAVSEAGDVNGDGFADLFIGADRADPGGINYSGSSYVIFGKADGFASAISLSTLDGSSGFRLDGVADGDRSGYSVSGAGDVNGDGFADLVVGTRWANPNGVRSGSTYVVFGKADGFPSAIGLSTLDGTDGFRLDGVSDEDRSGFSVSSAGDVNGDGYDDLVIGAYLANPSGTVSGASYVVFGNASGYASSVNLSALDGTAGFRLDAAGEFQHSGKSVSGAGDVNGDGIADLIIGAPRATPFGRLYAGSSYIVFGKAGDFASAVNLSTLNGVTGFRLEGVSSENYSGEEVSGAGDINGDGFDDILVGAPRTDFHDRDSGSTYVMFGKASGFSSSVNLSQLDGLNGFRMDGPEVSIQMGGAVSAAGDVNGDGFDDIIMGAYRASVGDSRTGSAYVVFGRAPDAATTRIGSQVGQYITGGAFADRLSGVGGHDILEGRAGADILDGGIGLDWASYTHAPTAVKASLALPAANTGDAAGDQYQSIERLEGSAFDDTLTGNDGSNRLRGGQGSDTLKGGKGRDVFVLRSASDSLPGSRDTILDFNPGTRSGFVDVIRVSAVDADTSIGGNQAFTFIGTQAFSAAGQIRLLSFGNDVIVQGNTDASTAPEFEIVLKGIKSKISAITVKDFRL